MTSIVKYFFILLISTIFLSPFATAQYTRQDTLRGSIGPARAWWDVKHYNINIEVNIEKKQIEGYNQLTFEVLEPGKNKIMQIDLQEPMTIVSVEDVNNKYKPVPFKREGNVYWIDFGDKYFSVTKKPKDQESIYIRFKGNPHEAVRPPWDGGWIWTKDEKGRPWITVACQGLGASAWYPCKDHQSDEPDEGAILNVTVPDSLVAVAAGLVPPPPVSHDGMKSFGWRVMDPINNYNIVPYIGKYVSWNEAYQGENGMLRCDYWVLDYDLAKAKKQFSRDVKPMLKCFEEWFDPYPFYRDGYKLVETPHLGMEHQSAIAYGNKFLDGYLGSDLSGTGWGTKWDYIIVHESGHEWFGNNITTRDVADMWVHEGFTTYSEVLYVECQSGKKAADEYCQGLRQNIQNDVSMIGDYGVNKEGSGDMYAKGANMLHTIRQVINDDAIFKKILRGLNKEFYHKLVTTKDIENYMTSQSGKNLAPVFDQYLRTNQLPQLEYKIEGTTLSYRWTNCIKGFTMPVKVLYAGKEQWITAAEEWQAKKMDTGFSEGSFSIDKNFYISSKRISN